MLGTAGRVSAGALASNDWLNNGLQPKGALYMKEDEVGRLGTLNKEVHAPDASFLYVLITTRGKRYVYPSDRKEQIQKLQIK